MLLPSHGRCISTRGVWSKIYCGELWHAQARARGKGHNMSHASADTCFVPQEVLGPNNMLWSTLGHLCICLDLFLTVKCIYAPCKRLVCVHLGTCTQLGLGVHIPVHAPKPHAYNAYMQFTGMCTPVHILVHAHGRSMEMARVPWDTIFFG